MPEPIDLSDVVVLVAGLNSLAGGTAASLANMAVAGAMLQYGECFADVSLTRNLQAYCAERAFLEDESLQWVFWLDHDVMVLSEGVRDLRELARASGGSVSGLYVNRHQREPMAAAECVKRQQAKLIESNGTKTMLLPALTGLGAFMQSRASFLKHCEESTRFSFHTYRDVPAVCTSGAVRHELVEDIMRTVGEYVWVSEDFDYCIREFTEGRPVYLSHVACKHNTTSWLMPPDQVVVPGYHAELMNDG